MRKHINRNPLRKVVEVIQEPMLDMQNDPLIIYGEIMHQSKELLECGHKVRATEDFYGTTHATRRRCAECGKETI